MMAGRVKGKAGQLQAVARWAERNDARLEAMAEKRAKREKVKQSEGTLYDKQGKTYDAGGNAGSR